MKTKLILLLISCMSVISYAQDMEQYEPFLGKDTTVQYYYIPTNSAFCIDCPSYIADWVTTESVKDWGYRYAICGVSFDERNSKLWSLDGGNLNLWMDLDLAVGDYFEIVPGKSYKVNRVYWENERKHILFDFSFQIWVDSLNEETGDGWHWVSYESTLKSRGH